MIGRWVRQLLWGPYETLCRRYPLVPFHGEVTEPVEGVLRIRVHNVVVRALARLSGGYDYSVSYLVDGELLIDTGFPWARRALASTLPGLGSRAQIRVVVNTHYHEDHTGNNDLLRELGASILAHADAVPEIRFPPTLPWYRRFLFGPPPVVDVDVAPDELRTKSCCFRVLHMPGPYLSVRARATLALRGRPLYRARSRLPARGRERTRLDREPRPRHRPPPRGSLRRPRSRRPGRARGFRASGAQTRAPPGASRPGEGGIASSAKRPGDHSTRLLGAESRQLPLAARRLAVAPHRLRCLPLQSRKVLPRRDRERARPLDVPPGRRRLAGMVSGPATNRVYFEARRKPRYLDARRRWRRASTGHDRSGGEYEPRWSPDGRWLAFQQLQPARILGLPGTGAGESRILAKGPAQGYCWSRDGTLLFYTGFREKAGNLWAASLESGKEYRVTDFFGRRGQLGGSAVATDGEHLYFHWDEDVADLWVMELKR